MDTDMFGSNQRPPMPRFDAIYPPFFAAKSVCIGVYPWLKPGSVAAWLLHGSLESLCLCVHFFWNQHPGFWSRRM